MVNRDPESTTEQLQSRIEHLEIAVQAGRRIGVAVGIIMATEMLTEEDAFDRLRCASQSTSEKLRDIAERVVLTGTL